MSKNFSGPAPIAPHTTTPVPRPLISALFAAGFIGAYEHPTPAAVSSRYALSLVRGVCPWTRRRLGTAIGAGSGLTTITLSHTFRVKS